MTKVKDMFGARVTFGRLGRSGRRRFNLNLLTIRPCPTVPDVRRRIEEALKRSAEVDAGGISVKIQDDKVVLEGGTRAWHERSVAERTAWSVPGVPSRTTSASTEKQGAVAPSLSPHPPHATPSA
ncbi:BON domain-containing protein [Rhizobium leguminosarum]|uniref:BON domain-containing protein n=1 Tax=Rhizobium leguminosarum TaxID=384 RepID=UPI001FED96FC|nr:BON domain-containing protein [Rhizobium leguminosarum]